MLTCWREPDHCALCSRKVSLYSEEDGVLSTSDLEVWVPSTGGLLGLGLELESATSAIFDNCRGPRASDRGTKAKQRKRARNGQARHSSGELWPLLPGPGEPGTWRAAAGTNVNLFLAGWDNSWGWLVRRCAW